MTSDYMTRSMTCDAIPRPFVMNGPDALLDLLEENFWQHAFASLLTHITYLGVDPIRGVREATRRDSAPDAAGARQAPSEPESRMALQGLPKQELVRPRPFPSWSQMLQQQ